jgi:hypothetical protein
MGGSCGTYEGKERCIQDFDGENVKGEDKLEDLGTDGSTVSK